MRIKTFFALSLGLALAVSACDPEVLNQFLQNEEDEKEEVTDGKDDNDGKDDKDGKDEKDDKDEVVQVVSISLDKAELILEEGKSGQLTATVKPDDATDKTVVWSSSDASVATVSGGKVTAAKAGSAVITAKAGDKTAECKLVVTVPVVEVTSFKLDRPFLLMKPLETDELVPGSIYPSNATDQTAKWSVADPSVATVENGKVTALKGGETVLTAKMGQKEQTAKIYVIEEVVDMGLTVKWRGWNLGADNPREKGDYYAWGETETYYSSLNPVKWKTGKSKGYNIESYKFRTAGYTVSEDGTGDLKVSKYNSVEGHGTVDGKTVLDPEDDAANVVLGNGWRMPTRLECEQLLSARCKNEYINDNKGVQGRLFTGPTGNKIFFEITGYYFNLYTQSDTYILLWTSDLYDKYVPEDAYTFHMIGSNIGTSSAPRSNGRVIRPVRE